MSPARSLPHALALSLCAGLVASSAALAQPKPRYQPRVGQEGKDVVWVPTERAVVNKMLEVARVTPQDYVIDLGSGDGRTVVAAAKRGARALGVEYNPKMVELSRRNLARAGVGSKASIVQGDLFETDFSEATVLTMFLLPSINIRLRPKILAMKPGTRVVSNSFTMEDWQPDRTVEIGGKCETFCTAYLWVVPANLEGAWQTAEGALALEQRFQAISGTLTTGNVVAPITRGKLDGNRVTFTAAGRVYEGRVQGNVVEGTVAANGQKSPWRATKG